MQSSLVYQFSCVNCTFGYVGCSRRTLATRVAEHAGKSSRTGRALTTPPHSSVREHAETCGSPVTMNQFKILDFCNSNNDLCIMESLYIYKLKPAINDYKALIPCILSIGSAFVFVLSLCVFVSCVFVSVCITLFHQYVRWLGVNQVCGVCCALYIVSSFEIFLLKYLLFSFIFLLRAIFVQVYRYAFIIVFF